MNIKTIFIIFTIVILIGLNFGCIEKSSDSIEASSGSIIHPPQKTSLDIGFEDGSFKQYNMVYKIKSVNNNTIDIYHVLSRNCPLRIHNVKSYDWL